jgi:hypothetical protein
MPVIPSRGGPLNAALLPDFSAGSIPAQTVSDNSVYSLDTVEGFVKIITLGFTVSL